MSIMHFIGMPKGMNKAAYSGNLNCPWQECQSRAIKYVEHVTPFRLRYRCRKCGKTFQYDISGVLEHPYAPFKKNKRFRFVSGWDFSKPRGGTQ